MTQNTDDVPDGNREVRRAGDEPPDIPSESTLEDLLPRLLDGVDEVATGYHVRAALRRDDPDGAAEQLVDALERKVTVLGSTLDAGVDPADPRIDVLIQCEYTTSQVASALGGVTPVRGAVVVEVTDHCERLLADDEPDDPDEAADANDVFNELQEQVSEVDYDQVVDELEDVSFPGGPDPDEEIDLEAEADVDLGMSDNGTGDGDVALDGDLGANGADADGSLGADGDDADGGLDGGDVDAKDLFGEGDGAADDGSGAVSEPDDDRIEEAIQSVELSMNDDLDDEPGTDGLDDEPGTDGLDDESGTDGRDEGSETDVALDGSDDGSTVDVEQVDADLTVGGTASDAGSASGSPDGAASEAGPGPGSGDGAARADDAGDGSLANDGASAGPSEDAEVDQRVDDLVAALESGAVDAERRQRLREALGVESTHSLDVRLEYLQKRVDNLAAYTDAWEAFLAEEGTADQFVGEIEEELDALSARVDALESGDAGGGDDQRLAELRRSHEEDVARLEQRIDDLADGHGSRLDDLETTVESLRRSVEALGNWRDRVNDLLDGRRSG